MSVQLDGSFLLVISETVQLEDEFVGQLLEQSSAHASAQSIALFAFVQVADMLEKGGMVQVFCKKQTRLN